MKKALIITVMILLLAGCVRPATTTDWSPINSVKTQTSSIQTTAQPTHTLKAGETPQMLTPTPWPTLDLSLLPEELPEGMKGYELFSWLSGGTWNFTLVTGTNRLKSFEELMSPENVYGDQGLVKISVSGVEEIKKVLDRLPAKTEIFWSGMDLTGQVTEGTTYFSYPPQEIVDELTTFCKTKKLNLNNLAESE